MLIKFDQFNQNFKRAHYSNYKKQNISKEK